MISADIRTSVLQRLDEVWRLCPEMRLGQVFATVGLLGEDTTGRSLWDLEDDEALAAARRLLESRVEGTAARAFQGTSAEETP